MRHEKLNRRKFIQGIAGSAAAMAAVPQAAFGRGLVRHEASGQAAAIAPAPVRIRFAVIGINHSHINSQVTAVQHGGGELVSVYAKEPDLLADFTKRFPAVKVARGENEILEDKTIQLVLSSGIPDERAPLGIRVMQHGKDYMVDKPGITTLEQLAEVRRVQ
ncbi:MAG: Gfo/Idh/MocA family oxidoreductase, partial [Acidobacteriota bacterium]